MICHGGSLPWHFLTSWVLRKGRKNRSNFLELFNFHVCQVIYAGYHVELKSCTSKIPLRIYWLTPMDMTILPKFFMDLLEFRMCYGTACSWWHSLISSSWLAWLMHSGQYNSLGFHNSKTHSIPSISCAWHMKLPSCRTSSLYYHPDSYSWNIPQQITLMGSIESIALIKSLFL